MNIQAAKTVYCISIDPDPINGGVGGSQWHSTREAADAAYEVMLNDSKHDGDTLIRFDLKVPASATSGDVTELVDGAAWEHAYEPVRVVTVAIAH